MVETTVGTSFSISIFSSARDNEPEVVQLPLDEFVSLLTGPPELVEGCPSSLTTDEDKKLVDKLKTSGEAWSPALFKKGTTRKKENVESLCALVFDFDKGKDGKAGIGSAEFHGLLEYMDNTGLLWMAHDSFTCGYYSQARKFRIVLPLLTPVTAVHYETLWNQWEKALPLKPDPACRDVSRIYFSPAIPSQFRDRYWSVVAQGGTALLKFEGLSKKPSGLFKSSGVSLNTVKVGQGRTEEDWLELVRTAEQKDDTLKSAVPGLVRCRLLAGKSLDGLWDLVKAALEKNANPVKDWKHAEDLFKRQSEWAINKWEEEKTVSEPDPLVSDHIPTEKEKTKALSKLKKWEKYVKADTTRLKEAAYLAGAWCPHVLSFDHVRHVLTKAACDPDAKPKWLRADEAEEPITLGLAQSQKKKTPTSWQAALIKDADECYPCSDENARLLLLNHPDVEGVVRHDVRLDKPIIMKRPPWDTTAEEWPAVFEEHDAGSVAVWMTQTLRGKTIGNRRALEAVISVAKTDQFDPFVDWLEDLKWDGTKRLDTWLIEYGNAKDDEYMRMISSKFLLSAVARSYEPNTPADCMIVLVGEQGEGKSRLLRSLLPADRYFLDTMGDIKDKDTQLCLQEFVIIEIQELMGFNKKEANEIKSFISGRNASVRGSYERLRTSINRRAVFAGSTNDQAFIRDDTGGRRYWPVYVSKCKPLELAVSHEQIWAEAVGRYKSGEPCWLTSEQEGKARSYQDNVRDVDALESDLLAILEHPLKQGTWITTVKADKEENIEGKFVVYEDQTDAHDRLRWVTAGQVCDLVGLRKTERKDQIRAASMLKASGYRQMDRLRAGRHLVRPYFPPR